MKFLFPLVIMIAILGIINSVCRDYLVNNYCNDLTIKEYEGVYFPVIGALIIYFKMVSQGRI